MTWLASIWLRCYLALLVLMPALEVTIVLACCLPFIAFPSQTTSQFSPFFPLLLTPIRCLGTLFLPNKKISLFLAPS